MAHPNVQTTFFPHNFINIRNVSFSSCIIFKLFPKSKKLFVPLQTGALDTAILLNAWFNNAKHFFRDFFQFHVVHVLFEFQVYHGHGNISQRCALQPRLKSKEEEIGRRNERRFIRKNQE